MYQTTGFARIEELPLSGRHRRTPDGSPRHWRMVIVSDEAVVTAYREAIGPAHALLLWATDMAWTRTHDVDETAMTVARLAVKVYATGGNLGDDYWEDLGLVEELTP